MKKTIIEPLSVGPYQVLPLRCGLFRLDGGAMFGTVPKVLWEKWIPADEKNRIPMQTRVLLLIAKDRKILIDTGNGTDFEAKYGEKLGTKFAEIYGINGPTTIKETLLQLGIQPNEITDVILTHLHFDHAGGATCLDQDGKTITPTFPKARYFVQRRNLEVAKNPNVREKASYLDANIQPLQDSGQLHLLDGPVRNLLPNVHVYLSNGHTEGQQLVWVEDEKTALFYGADLIPTHAHIRLPWVMGYDLQPLLLIEEKKEQLERLVGCQGYVFFEHDPFFDCAKVKKTGDDFAFDEAFEIRSGFGLI